MFRKFFPIFIALLLTSFTSLISPQKVDAYITNPITGVSGPTFNQYQFVINAYRPDISDFDQSQLLVTGENFDMSVYAYKQDQEEKNLFKSQVSGNPQIKFYYLLKNPTNTSCFLNDGGKTRKYTGYFETNTTGGDLYKKKAIPSSTCGAINTVAEQGTYKVTVWASTDSEITANPNNTLIQDAEIKVGTKQGGATRLEKIPNNESVSYICSNKPAKVNLINTEGGASYFFKWSTNNAPSYKVVSPANNADLIRDIPFVDSFGNAVPFNGQEVTLTVRVGNSIYGSLIGSGLKYITLPDSNDPRCQTQQNASCQVTVQPMGTTGPNKSRYKVSVVATGLIPNGTYLGELLKKSDGTGWSYTKIAPAGGTTDFVFISQTSGQVDPVPSGTYLFKLSSNGGADVWCQKDPINIGSGEKPVDLLPKCGDAGVECAPAKGEVCDGGKGILTAIGCIPTDPNEFINALMRVAAFGGGGIALLLMIFGAIQMVSSAGNPETLKKGQETFTAAIIGLLFIIFATLLLQIIGVDILSLPGFGT